MASGTGNLPYPGKSYSPFDILTAEELNEDVANIESLATGVGLGDKSIPTAAYGDGTVTAGKTDFGGNYSTSEVNTGFKWVNNKDIYKKTINFGALPNATTKNVAHGITSLEHVINQEAWAYRASPLTRKVIPSVNTTNVSNQYTVDNIDNTNISIISAVDVSGYTICYVTIWYTKT